jgi:N-acetylmuramoyl-L-alanine amidase
MLLDSDRKKEKGSLQMRSVSLIFFVMLLFLATSLPAQKKTDVKLKFSGQGSNFRIVFEAEDPFVQKTRVTTSSSQIRLDFPEYFDLTGQKDLPFEILQSGRSLVINFRGTPQITFFRLSLPARLVFDIRKREVEPEKQAAQVPSRGIVIDVGHGGYDFGITYGTTSEKDISLALARDLAAALSRKGRKVFLDRKVDQYVSLAGRIDFVNRERPGILISLHSSLSKDFALYSPRFEEQAVSGPADFYSLQSKAKKYVAKSKSLADAIETALKEEFRIDVIRREMPLPLLDSAGAPSVLIEYPSPAFIVYDQKTRMRLVNSVMNGIAAYEQ